MLQSWRWFGPNDPVTLGDVRQAGATGIVSALHEIGEGRAWTDDDVGARKAEIEAAGLTWAVCESIPVPVSLKLRDAGWSRALGIWTDSLAALGRAGVGVVCYNFMPVVDWTRTDLRHPMPSTGLALRFDVTDFVAYDAFVLRRPGAEADYDAAVLERAATRLASLDDAAVARLETNIIAGLPGGDGSYDRAGIAARIAAFDGVTADDMRGNLADFLRAVVPVAEEFGVRLAIHPDDPPMPLFGLPRIVSTAADARALLAAVDRPANGLTLCAGSYGSRADNDLVAMAEEFGPRIHFAHLRNVTRDDDGSFVESDHLAGDVDMAGLIAALMREEARRRAEGRADAEIPMRPDHGHLLADDLRRTTNPGYSLIGRLKGLAELRGVMTAVERFGLA
ncbi:mannonate dehydratase [Methylobrevis albus]|uniref:Mannonate dehydratase n=1 Tax=Methylobrevis albus TaxID=2793297 RepID=A0A931MYD9_9HYPH|nr:mannonate dehydratase [Methylobrevis albus]MBH0238312.1 mannonate dehydratase [Methylobrevis albus]